MHVRRFGNEHVMHMNILYVGMADRDIVMMLPACSNQSHRVEQKSTASVSK